jgi:hypothetical protein
MKKATLILSLFLIALGSFAIEPVFELNEAELSKTFNTLNQIEALIIANPELTPEDIKLSHSELAENVNFESSAILKTAGDMPVLGAFWWGCILGIIGLVLVYIVTDNDKQQTKTALIGCIVGTLVFGGIFALSNAFTWF